MSFQHNIVSHGETLVTSSDDKMERYYKTVIEAVSVAAPFFFSLQKSHRMIILSSL